MSTLIFSPTLNVRTHSSPQTPQPYFNQILRLTSHTSIHRNFRNRLVLLAAPSMPPCFLSAIVPDRNILAVFRRLQRTVEGAPCDASAGSTSQQDPKHPVGLASLVTRWTAGGAGIPICSSASSSVHSFTSDCSLLRLQQQFCLSARPE